MRRRELLQSSLATSLSVPGVEAAAGKKPPTLLRALWQWSTSAISRAHLVCWHWSRIIFLLHKSGPSLVELKSCLLNHRF